MKIYFKKKKLMLQKYIKYLNKKLNKSREESMNETKKTINNIIGVSIQTKSGNNSNGKIKLWKINLDHNKQQQQQPTKTLRVKKPIRSNGDRWKCITKRKINEKTKKKYERISCRNKYFL